jgi:ribosomal protein S18 acetylase RimI-like enzyme
MRARQLWITRDVSGPVPVLSGELTRAWTFMRRADAAGESNEPSPLGTAVRDRRVPLRHDSNYLLVERPATRDEIVQELRRLRLPVATVPDESLLTDGADGPEIAHRGVVMVHRGQVPAAPHAAVQVPRERLSRLRRAITRSYPWGSPEVAAQLLEAKAFIEERLPTRFYAAEEDGEVVACADLYVDPPDAQIEDVATSPRHRGRGHGAAVVLTALADARESGADFVFLVADADDWPRDWYARLGFEPIGGYVKLRPAGA